MTTTTPKPFAHEKVRGQLAELLASEAGTGEATSAARKLIRDSLKAARRQVAMAKLRYTSLKDRLSLEQVNLARAETLFLQALELLHAPELLDD